MASEYYANFLVQRGDQQFICRGDKLYSRVTSTDLFAVQRDGVLYHATKEKLHDSDWLVCMDGTNTRRIAGSKVILMLLPPPALKPLVVKINGQVYDPSGTVETYPPNSELTFECDVNPDSLRLNREYEWQIRQGGGQFISSSKARLVAYQTGSGGPETVSCGVSAIGASDSPAATEAVQFFITA